MQVALSIPAFETQCREMPKHRLSEFSKTLNRITSEKYPHSKRNLKLESSVMDTFTNEQLTAFFEAVKSPGVREALKTIYFLALRVSELGKITPEDIDFKNHLIKIHNKKNGTTNFLPLEGPAWQILHERVKTVKEHSSCVFPQEKVFAYSPDYLRNQFRKTCNRIGLNQTYGRAQPRTFLACHKGNLHCLTTHSLRKTRLTNFYQKTKDVKLTQLLGRHRNPSTTLRYYIHPNLNELSETLKTETWEAIK